MERKTVTTTVTVQKDFEIWTPAPTFENAIEAAKGLVNDPGYNDEYERGILEFIIDLFGVGDGMDMRGELAEALGWEF